MFYHIPVREDPMEVAFRVKFVIDVCYHRLSMILSGRREEKQATNRLFGRLVSQRTRLLILLRLLFLPPDVHIREKKSERPKLSGNLSGI